MASLIDPAKGEQPSGCVFFVTLVVMPLLSMVVTTLGLIDGAVLTLRCERIEPRQVEEVLETSGVITRPVERVIQEGRVDVTVTRRIVGLIPLEEVVLQDVVDTESSSGTTDVTNRSGHRTSSYSTESIELTTRAGQTWQSPTVSHSFGTSPGKMRERLDEFLAGSSTEALVMRSVPWLSNIIGVPFAFITLLFIWAWIMRLRNRLFGRTRPAAAAE